MSFIAIIPARYFSTRLPGKPLADINGKPMVVRVMEQAQASGAGRVIVATDHHRVAEIVKQAGGECCLTRSDHQSGTERLQEVINYYDFPSDQIIVNVQGDEPLIPPKTILQVAENLAAFDASMATLATPITTSEEKNNPNVVKVVIDFQGYALYFSRTAIPRDRKMLSKNCKGGAVSHNLLRHIGIYAYRADFIRRYFSWKASPLEKVEVLEQLRVLWYGEKIHVGIACVAPGMGVDTQKELTKIRFLQKQLNEESPSVF